MARGRYGGPRPFAEGELIYVARYNISRDVGEQLEDSSYRGEKEEMISESVKQVVRNASVELHPAGFIVSVHIGLGAADVTDKGVNGIEFRDLQQSVDNAVERHIDDGASQSGFDMDTWEIKSK